MIQIEEVGDGTWCDQRFGATMALPEPQWPVAPAEQAAGQEEIADSPQAEVRSAGGADEVVKMLDSVSVSLPVLVDEGGAGGGEDEGNQAVKQSHQETSEQNDGSSEAVTHGKDVETEGAAQEHAVQGQEVQADYMYSGERDEDDLPHGMGRCVYTRTGLVYEGEFVHGGAFEIARGGLGDTADVVRELTHRVPKLIAAS